jgi:hypothetical protein
MLPSKNDSKQDSLFAIVREHVGKLAPTSVMLAPDDHS